MLGTNPSKANGRGYRRFNLCYWPCVPERGSFANSRVGIEQKRLRFLHSNSREVVDEIYPGRFLEHLAKVMPANISRVGYPPERQRLRLIPLDELPCSRHVRGLVLFAPYDQLIRQDRKVLRKNTQQPQHRAIPVGR